MYKPCFGDGFVHSCSLSQDYVPQKRQQMHRGALRLPSSISAAGPVLGLCLGPKVTRQHPASQHEWVSAGFTTDLLGRGSLAA